MARNTKSDKGGSKQMEFDFGHAPLKKEIETPWSHERMRLLKQIVALHHENAQLKMKLRCRDVGDEGMRAAQ